MARVLLMVALLLGCQAGAKLVQGYGHERFIVSRHSYMSPAVARQTCIRVANRHCKERGRVMVPIDKALHRSPLGSGSSVVFVFDCEVPKWRK